MTLREIIYDINEIFNAYSDDHKISEEHIAFMVNNKRNLLLKQFMSNLKKEVPREAIQKVCLSMEIDDNCFEDKKVLRSTVKFPATLENTGRSNIIRAFSKDLKFTKNINIIDYYRLPFVGAEKYNDNQLFISIDPDSYIIIYNSKNKHIFIEDIELEGVFEDPEKAYDLSCDSSSNSECDFFDAQYPIEASLIDMIKNQIIQELILKYQIPEDKINNAEEDNKIENVRFTRTRRNP